MGKTNIIRVRRRIKGAKYCACDDSGNPIRGFNKLSEIRRYWKMEIQRGDVVLVLELDKKPDMDAVIITIKQIEAILRAYAARR